MIRGGHISENSSEKEERTLDKASPEAHLVSRLSELVASTFHFKQL